jgi:hypothetical protein
LKFINFNFNNQSSKLIALDYISIESDQHNTITVYVDHFHYNIEPFTFNIDMENFLQQAFTDTGSGEYEIIDIDEDKPGDEDLDVKIILVPTGI